MGGDPIHGVGFIECLELFEADDETEAVVLIGEIGGDDEERAAAFVRDHISKPVVAYIAGFSAPPGKRMGHAGAIVEGASGTAADKKAALERAGIPVAATPPDVARILAMALNRTQTQIGAPRDRGALRGDGWRAPRRGCGQSGTAPTSWATAASMRSFCSLVPTVMRRCVS